MHETKPLTPLMMLDRQVKEYSGHGSELQAAFGLCG